ncbi:MAG: DUF4097 family beta strand repeat-containing protein, partial [Planctomycetota bacterium]
DLRAVTDNGAVSVRIPDDVSAKVSATSDNGVIRTNRTLSEATRTKNSLSGKIGDGQGSIELQTDNGSITID